MTVLLIMDAWTSVFAKYISSVPLEVVPVTTKVSQHIRHVLVIALCALELYTNCFQLALRFVYPVCFYPPWFKLVLALCDLKPTAAGSLRTCLSLYISEPQVSCRSYIFVSIIVLIRREG